LAAADYKKALARNPNSALANYLFGELYDKSTFFTKEAAADVSDLTGASGGFRDTMRLKALDYFNRAIVSDPNFKYGNTGAAEALSALKRFSDSIPKYDRAIELDSQDSGSLNDRGVAKTHLNDYLGAITDFSGAIKIKETSKNSVSDTHLDMTYENRADAYAKSMNYDSAIDDYGKAIGLKLASQVFLMSLPRSDAVS